ncbi:hypothetical protein [Clostridium sp. HBUAS56010]|uniref:hypothetical protein n=1 Tax=Clostridium sp. HBUAS56010 TaxID=2571127 RepID=UPI00117750D9|nr:hypothetical protein [Clostridium sp. HBUAS56010]
MDYYRITQKDNWLNVIKPRFPHPTDLWGRTEPFFLPGISEDSKEPSVFLPIYMSDSFLVSDHVKVIWKKYQKGGRYHPCAFGNVEQRRIFPYCFVMPRILDGVHPDTTYHKNGDIKELYLDKKIIGANRVFGIQTIRRIWLIVSDDVLEVMIRENITGFNWSKIKTGQE